MVPARRLFDRRPSLSPVHGGKACDSGRAETAPQATVALTDDDGMAACRESFRPSVENWNGSSRGDVPAIERAVRVPTRGRGDDEVARFEQVCIAADQPMDRLIVPDDR